MMNAATQNTWTSYRDGRRVMHYMRADGGRYFVQKVKTGGYNVSFLADEGDGVSVNLTTEDTLAAGKRWVEAYTGTTFDTAFRGDEPQQHPNLADCAAKFEGGPQLPPGTYTATLEGVGVSASGDIITSAVVHGFGSRCIQIVGRCHRIRPHRPRTYNALTLGIDCFKVIRTAHFVSMLQCDRASTQDDYVCRIERELAQYAGRRKTPTLSRKVDRLRKILRTLKRGLYE